MFRSLVGKSAGISKVRSLIDRVAPGDSTVLILGETGTGKEVVARNIHYRSQRSNAEFAAVNCAAIPADLLESELFGHERGAFTGALTTRKGRFELASGGTLFLDEIGDMGIDMQVKLLRVLQEQCFYRIGGSASVDVDVRIIAATHHDIEYMVGKGRFREDLYYRLNVVPIVVPPLRERREDIPLLISELNARLRARGLESKDIEPHALAAMVAYDWPGNVRELANILERCSNMVTGDRIEVKHLPGRIRASPRGAAAANELPPIMLSALEQVDFRSTELKTLLDSVEAFFIRQALEEAEGVVTGAAHRLGVRRSTLVDKIRKLGIERPGT